MIRQARPISAISSFSTLAEAGGIEGVEGKRAELRSTSRVPGRKRKQTFQRKYAAAVQAIERGDILPEVKPVSAFVACSTRTASSILAKAVDSDERFTRDIRGRVMFAEVA